MHTHLTIDFVTKCFVLDLYYDEKCEQQIAKTCRRYVLSFPSPLCWHPPTYLAFTNVAPNPLIQSESEGLKTMMTY